MLLGINKKCTRFYSSPFALLLYGFLFVSISGLLVTPAKAAIFGYSDDESANVYPVGFQSPFSIQNLPTPTTGQSSPGAYLALKITTPSPASCYYGVQGGGFAWTMTAAYDVNGNSIATDLQGVSGVVILYFPGGQWYNGLSASFFTLCTGSNRPMLAADILGTLWAYEGDTLAPPPAPGATLTPFTPQNGDILTKDFSYWQVIGQNMPTGTTLTISALYSPSSSINPWDGENIEDTMQFQVSENPATGTLLRIPKKYPFQLPLTDSSTYWVKFYLYTTSTPYYDCYIGFCIVASTTNIAETDFINFKLVPSGTNPWDANTTTTPVDICEQYGGNGFMYGFCGVMMAVFRPADTVLDNFTGLGDMVKTKPPMGYFSIIASDISGISDTGTDTLMTASTTSAFSPIFSPVRLIFGTLLGLLTVFYFWKRFVHLEI